MIKIIQRIIIEDEFLYTIKFDKETNKPIISLLYSTGTSDTSLIPTLKCLIIPNKENLDPDIKINFIIELDIIDVLFCNEDIKEQVTNLLQYFDDLLVNSKLDQLEHFFEIIRMLLYCRKYLLFISKEKSEMLKTEVDFLAFHIHKDGISPRAAKVRSISELPESRNAKEAEAALGLFGFFRRHIENYSNDKPFAKRQDNYMKYIKEFGYYELRHISGKKNDTHENTHLEFVVESQNRIPTQITIDVRRRVSEEQIRQISQDCEMESPSNELVKSAAAGVAKRP
ncbi:hypothetical protein ACTFIW_000465 [Dictyostelium discoideum]